MPTAMVEEEQKFAAQNVTAKEETKDKVASLLKKSAAAAAAAKREDSKNSLAADRDMLEASYQEVVQECVSTKKLARESSKKKAPEMRNSPMGEESKERRRKTDMEFIFPMGLREKEQLPIDAPNITEALPPSTVESPNEEEKARPKRRSTVRARPGSEFVPLVSDRLKALG